MEFWLVTYFHSCCCAIVLLNDDPSAWTGQANFIRHKCKQSQTSKHCHRELLRKPEKHFSIFNRKILRFSDVTLKGLGSIIYMQRRDLQIDKRMPKMYWHQHIIIHRNARFISDCQKEVGSLWDEESRQIPGLKLFGTEGVSYMFHRVAQTMCKVIRWIDTPKNKMN